MTKEDNYRIETVVKNLRYLRDNWNQNVELDEVIRNSNVLRLLLVDDNLEKAWKLCGYTYSIRLHGFSLSNIIRVCGRARISIAWTGGALHRGSRYALGYGMFVDTENSIQKNELSKAPVQEEMTLDKYLKNPCMLVGDADINRAELIKYVANKLGGTHIDFKRDFDKPLDRKFLMLDSLHNYRDVDKNIIPYQLLSIGQELVASRHIQRLMKRSVKSKTNLPDGVGFTKTN